MVNLQDKEVVIGTPVEIEKATNQIRLLLSELEWVSHPYHIAQRFYRKQGQRAFYYPETYAGGDERKLKYHRLTPDNDYTGMFFFYVGKERNEYNNNEFNFLRYDVAIIFSVNLKLIDEYALGKGLYTQELIRDVRRMLTKNAPLFDFRYKIKTVTRDLKEVYRDFVLDDIEQYNRAPMQCFRFDMEIMIQEDCFEGKSYNVGGDVIPPEDGDCPLWTEEQF